MCGILALIKTSKTHNSTKIDSILESGKPLSNRGPDNLEVSKNNGDVFVFYRLSIMDVSDKGKQPFIIDNCTLVCNGEIYNFKELIKKYDLDCSSDSDCEVIIKLYLKLNDFYETVSLLDGVFAIVLLDRNKNKLFVARDRVGVRPLFFGITKEEEVITSSLVKSMLPLCRRNPQTGCVDSIQPVFPNTIMTYDLSSREHNIKINQIPNFELNPQQLNCNLENSINQVRDILYNSVKKRVNADRPIACLLSGGLDSSIIAALLCKVLGPENVRTYSIGMKGSTDLFYAQKVANFLKTQHTVVHFTEEVGLSTIPYVVKAIESYDITTIRASVPMWLISKYISDNTEDKVIFSGEGADELFCGYLYFHNAPNDRDLEHESKRLVNELYTYDVLRSDRTVSDCGLEFREPFLDKELVEFALNLSGEVKKPINGYEKYILRKAFEDILPQEVIWRRKEGFSDGNSSLDRAWKDIIGEHVDKIIDTYDSEQFMSKEQYYYVQLFNSYFPGYNLMLPPWMPKWSGDLKDPSGRLIKAFDEKMDI
jgi:asparagine synthase (glutamine-hydrolysing)